MEERLQKILARAGLASRRHCEELIREGRVAVNGQVAQLGQKADPRRDRIVVDGRPVEVGLPRTYVALHKPLGVLSSEDDGSSSLPAARGLVSLPGRLFPVGRLDLQSEGLILLTDDGELANLLTHPRYEHTKEYHVQVEGHPDAETIERWQQGILLDEKRTAPARVSRLRRGRSTTWLRVTLREGRKRQIRRVAEVLGHPVARLIRVRIGPINLGRLKPSEWRQLTEQELRELGKLKRRDKPARAGRGRTAGRRSKVSRKGARR